MALLLSTVVALANVGARPAAAATTYCNPLNIAYRFSMDPPSHREAADPTMVVHNDTYWLFASKSGGYWHSTDMNTWEFVAPTGLPLETYAPMVVVINETWFYTAFQAHAIFRTRDPYQGNWTKVTAMGGYSDPGMLVDDDGRVYMYSGCSSNGTIKAVELDPHTWQEIGPSVTVIEPDFHHRGFEVGGDNNEQLEHPPYVEGAWMNKLGGKYYLQYAVPGTQYKSYADGLFVADSPKGPFTFDPNSPMSSKPTGFAAGAGHSSTFAAPSTQSLYHIGTSSLSVRANFERRLGIYPAFLVGGTIVVDAYLGDYPHTLPGLAVADAGALTATKTPTWMLLTYNKSVTVSSTLNGSSPDGQFAPGNAVNEDMRTWWSATTGAANEWLSVDMGGSVTVNALQVNFADQDCSGIKGARPAPSDAYRWKVEYAVSQSRGLNGSVAAPTWISIPELDRSANTLDRPHDYVELATPLTNVGAMRITNLHMPCGSKFSLSGFRAFGHGAGAKPAQVTKVQAARDPLDQRHVNVSWPAVKGADFYVVRYGIPSFGWLFHNVQVYGQPFVEINALVDGQDYSFIVDSVNENGITLGTQPAAA